MGIRDKVKGVLSSCLVIMTTGIFLFFVGMGHYYNNAVVTYQKQLNLLINYIYEETAPSAVKEVYQVFLNLDSAYENRIKQDLGKSLVDRYKFYANLYTLRKIEYEEYLKYEQIILTLFPANDVVVDTMTRVQTYYESQRAYVKGTNMQAQGHIEEAIDSYHDVMFNDQHYYKLAQVEIAKCIQLIKEEYMQIAQQYFEKQQYDEAIKQLNYLTSNVTDEQVESLKWHYQSEYYVYLMDEIEMLIQDEQYGYLISYLEEVKPYLGTQYHGAINHRLSEATLLRATRRDSVLAKYRQSLRLTQLEQRHQQLITYNEIALESNPIFDVALFAPNVFTTIKSQPQEQTNDESILNEETMPTYLNIMPYLLTNDEVTSATFQLMLGYYDEVVNVFESIVVYVNDQPTYTYDVKKGDRQQVFVENNVVEWVTVTLSKDALTSMLEHAKPNAKLELEFVGEHVAKRVELSALELELVQMMIDIYDAIMN